MPAYVTEAEIETLIPGPYLIEATDDNRDGVADAGLLAQIIATGCVAVDAYLAGLYAVPFAAPVPAVAREAACVFVCEMIYARRGVSAADNSFSKRAEFWRGRLERIGKGLEPLDSTLARQFAPGAVVAESVSVDSGTG